MAHESPTDQTSEETAHTVRDRIYVPTREDYNGIEDEDVQQMWREFREESLLMAMDEVRGDSDGYVLYFDPRKPAVYRVLDVTRGAPDKWWFVAALADQEGNYLGQTRLHDSDVHLVLTGEDYRERDLSIETFAPR